MSVRVRLSELKPFQQRAVLRRLRGEGVVATVEGSPEVAEELSRILGASQAPRPKFNNKVTFCDAAHRHPSRVEAKVCGDLRTALLGTGLVLFHQVRLPLLASAPARGGRPLYFTVDFAIARPGGRLVRLVDAKSGRRRSPEWARGKAACEATYGLVVDELS